MDIYEAACVGCMHALFALDWTQYCTEFYAKSHAGVATLENLKIFSTEQLRVGDGRTRL